MRLMASKGCTGASNTGSRKTTARRQAPTTPGGDALRFHGVRVTDTDDTVKSVIAKQRSHADVVTIAGWYSAHLLAPAIAVKALEYFNHHVEEVVKYEH